MTSNNMMTAALDYAAQGMAVIPLHYPIQKNEKLVCSCGWPN